MINWWETPGYRWREGRQQLVASPRARTLFCPFPLSGLPPRGNWHLLFTSARLVGGGKIVAPSAKTKMIENCAHENRDILNLGGSIDFTIWTPPKVKNKPSQMYSTLIECLSSARLVSTHRPSREKTLGMAEQQGEKRRAKKSEKRTKTGKKKNVGGGKR